MATCTHTHATSSSSIITLPYDHFHNIITKPNILQNNMHAMMSYYTTNISTSISPTAASDKKLTCSLTSSSYISCPTSKVVCCASSSSNSKLVSGVVFEPFKEVKKELKLVTDHVGEKSLARHVFADESEASINEQINVEYNISYVYHAMYAYFDRDNVGLKGLAKFFKESSKEKRGHAEKFMEYQNKRGGKVKLHSILMPVSEFHNQEKGDASQAMELALSLEKLTNEKLLHVHEVGDKNNDVHLAHFVKTEFLGEQLESIKKISEYVAQLRRVGKGHGVWHFNQMLLKEGGAAFSGDVTSQMFLEVF